MTTGWSLFVIVLTIVNILGLRLAAALDVEAEVRRPRRSAAARTRATCGTRTCASTTTRCRTGGCGCSTSPWCSACCTSLLFPGLGNFAGIKGWTQAGQYDAEKRGGGGQGRGLPRAVRRDDRRRSSRPTRKAMATARNLFQNNCAQCHGSDGGGAHGLPEPRRRGLAVGRRSRHDRGDDRRRPHRRRCRPGARCSASRACDEVVAYVQTLSGQQADAALAAAGKTHLRDRLRRPATAWTARASRRSARRT